MVFPEGNIPQPSQESQHSRVSFHKVSGRGEQQIFINDQQNIKDEGPDDDEW